MGSWVVLVGLNGLFLLNCFLEVSGTSTTVDLELFGNKKKMEFLVVFDGGCRRGLMPTRRRGVCGALVACSRNGRYRCSPDAVFYEQVLGHMVGFCIKAI